MLISSAGGRRRRGNVARGGDVEDLLGAMAAHWRAQGIKEQGGASPEAIRAFEARYGVRLPEDARAYFATLNGMEDGGWDDEFVHFWPLESVRSVAEELGQQEPVPPPADRYFCFADYSVWCNAYALRLPAGDGAVSDVVAVYGATMLVPVAPSFEEFLRRYLGPDRAAVIHPEFTWYGRSYDVAPNPPP